jgi:dihydroneopterin aldolase
MPHLLTPHELLLKTAEPHSQISVHNLQTTLPLARDAWGRPSKLQPLLISCTLSLRHPFSSTSTSDHLTNETIHYGILSKAILDACQEFRELCEDEVMPVPMHIKALVCYLQFYLTGCDTLPRIPYYVTLPTGQNPPTSAAKVEKDNGGKPKEVLVPCSMLNALSLEIVLPKASLMGSGIILEGDFIYEEGHHGPSAYSMVLKLRELHVPAIVGVNGNERKAKQVVVCNVEMERWDRMVDAYNELEEIVVKVPSSFFLLPSSFFLLPSSFFLLPSSFFLLPSSFFLSLSFSFCFTFSRLKGQGTWLMKGIEHRRIHLPNPRSALRPPRPPNHPLFPTPSLPSHIFTSPSATCSSALTPRHPIPPSSHPKPKPKPDAPQSRKLELPTHPPLPLKTHSCNIRRLAIGIDSTRLGPE